ncbi:unnamed protein product [Chrysoparadoxa australica]
MFECMWVHKFNDSRMHVAGYFAGLTHYHMLPLTVWVCAQSQDGYAAASAQDKNQGSSRDLSSIFHILISHVAGLCVFLVGSFQQNLAHRHLADLRLKAEQKPEQGEKTSDTYHLPHSGWFKWVSCPHYLCELLIYASYIIITRAQSPGLCLVAVWVFCNQCVTAHQCHAWYHSCFPSYPKQRKRIIPWLY